MLHMSEAKSVVIGDGTNQIVSALYYGAQEGLSPEIFFASNRGEEILNSLGRRHAHQAYKNAIWIQELRDVQKGQDQNADYNNLLLSLRRQARGRVFVRTGIYAATAVAVLVQLGMSIGFGNAANIDANTAGFFSSQAEQAARVLQERTVSAWESILPYASIGAGILLDKWFGRPSHSVYAIQLADAQELQIPASNRHGAISPIFVSDEKKEEGLSSKIDLFIEEYLANKGINRQAFDDTLAASAIQFLKDTFAEYEQEVGELTDAKKAQIMQTLGVIQDEEGFGCKRDSAIYRMLALREIRESTDDTDISKTQAKNYGLELSQLLVDTLSQRAEQRQIV